MSQIQDHLFRLIRQQLPPDASLADVVAELLHVSNDSAYRRIRGETPLVLEEAKLLCEAYHLSLDKLFGAGNDSMLFHSVKVDNEQHDFGGYLRGILQHLKAASAANEKEIIFLAKDLPLFHYFGIKPLFAFRYFFWMKSILQHPDFTNLKFSIDLLPPEIEKLGAEITELYNNIPSVEILNTECLNSFLAQVSYYGEAGYFHSPSDAAIIFEAMKGMVQHISVQAEEGCKFRPGENPALKKQNFNFFYNRLVLGDNTIMISTDGRRTLYINYEVLNYIVTQDEAFCNESYDKLQMLMRRGTILSTVSEKQRNAFFHQLDKKIASVAGGSD